MNYHLKITDKLNDRRRVIMAYLDLFKRTTYNKEITKLICIKDLMKMLHVIVIDIDEVNCANLQTIKKQLLNVPH